MQPQQNPNKTDEQPNQPRQANEAEQQRQSNSYSSNSQSQNSESHRSGGHSHNSEQVKEEVKNQNNQAQPNVNQIANSASANQNRQHDRKIRYKYCCKVCKHTDKSKKACVCVVPKNQRRTEIGQQGCQTCGCNGCSKEDFLSRGQDPEYKPGEKKKNRKQKDSIQFEARNGCCRKCMKAFSKSNKSCLCQVPEDVRNTKLPSSGCKICGCFGCNPEDKKDPRHRKTTRKEVSKSRSRQKHRSRRHARSPSQKSSSSQKEKDYIDPSTMNFYNVDKSASAWRNDGERVQNRSCITRIRYSSKNAQLHIRQTQMSSEKKEVRKLIKLLIISPCHIHQLMRSSLLYPTIKKVFTNYFNLINHMCLDTLNLCLTGSEAVGRVAVPDVLVVVVLVLDPLVDVPLVDVPLVVEGAVVVLVVVVVVVVEFEVVPLDPEFAELG